MFLCPRFYKQIAILRRQYRIVLTASWEKIYSVYDEYIFSQRRQYNAVLSSQNRALFCIAIHPLLRTGKTEN